MRRLEWLPYVLPLFVLAAPAVYELDSTFHRAPAPTIEIVASVFEEWECEEALTDPERMIVVYGPDVEQSAPQPELICRLIDTYNPQG